MKARRCSVLAAAFLVIVGGALCQAEVTISAQAGADSVSAELERQKETLAGLKAVAVGSEIGAGASLRGPVAQYYGLSDEELQESVKLMLRSRGIKVLSPEEIQNTRAPTLIVSVSIDRPQKPDKVLAGIELRLRQSVLLERDPNIFCDATTWRSKALAVVDTTNISQNVWWHVQPLAGKFAKDYLAANPEVAAEHAKRSGINTIPADKTTWVMCCNPACEAKYEINLREYFRYLEEHGDPRSPVPPALVCVKCGESSVYRAVKCGKCETVFERGTVPRTFSDECPKCGYSQIREDRKAAAKRRREAEEHGLKDNLR